MLFANYKDAEPIYEKDEDGNIIYETYYDTDGTEYTYPVEIGLSQVGYTSPQKMKGNIVFSGGETEAKEFGLDASDYTAILICPKDAYDINETSLIWFKNEVGYKDIEHTEIEPNTADFRVVKCSPSLNYDKYALRKVINNGEA